MTETAGIPQVQPLLMRALSTVVGSPGVCEGSRAQGANSQLLWCRASSQLAPLFVPLDPERGGWVPVPCWTGWMWAVDWAMRLQARLQAEGRGCARQDGGRAEHRWWEADALLHSAVTWEATKSSLELEMSLRDTTSRAKPFTEFRC